MTKIKICGLRRMEDILIVNKYKPDYIGFIFAHNKTRTISLNDALMFKEKLDNDIIAVGVFKDNDINEVINIANSNAIDMIQLHGNEDSNFILELKKHTKLPIIKAYSNYEYADYALFDNVDPGKGMTFDWATIKKDKPFFLAGGIDLNNIDEAKKLNPYCIDLSSSVEVNGFKDEEKIKEIIRKVRS
ncbi:MAG: phosphoribosylanthranilate isomerase [Acholeplasmatales bacterium]|nr:phosphoribosylanthranilate isomerase [Acholeplasmatales bacterium]